MVDWQIRQTHFEYDIVREKSPPPIPDGSGNFLVSYLVQLLHSFLYPFFRDKLELTRLLARPRFAVARVVDPTCVVMCVRKDEISDWLPCTPIKWHMP